MSIEWRKPCSHGRYEAHGMVGFEDDVVVIYDRSDCPGGSSVTTKDLEEVLSIGTEVQLLGNTPNVVWRYVSDWHSMPYEEWVKEMTPLLIREEQ